jgi:uncharacterized protein
LDRRTGAGEDPERTCIVSREVRSPQDMIRFVVGPDDMLVPDLKARLPGRGAWVTCDQALVREAVRRKAFARSLKVPVKVSPNLAEDVATLLERDALQALSFVNKAGEAICGFMKVESAIAKGRVAALLHACEAAPDGVRKLDQAIRRQANGAQSKIIVIDSFAADDLSLALGTPHVIHAALIAGPASRGFLARWIRLSRFRGSRPVEAVDKTDGPGGSETDALHQSQ